MSCRRTVLLLMLGFACVACGKPEDPSSSTGGNELPSGPPPTATISGTVTAPNGASTAGMTLLTPAGQASVGTGGAFSVEVYKGVPNLVMALVPGKTFGLSAVWTGNGEADIDLDSTIVAFVLTSPLLATIDQARMVKLDEMVRADEHFAGLRTALSAAYGSESPWDDPDVETAAHNLIGSVFGKAADDDSLVPKRLELRRQPLELETVQLALNEAQVHNIDREYVDVEVRNTGGKVEVTLSNEMSMGVGSAHSWVVEIASLKTDAYPFSNGWQAFDMSFDPWDVFERDGVLLHRVALPQASLFRYFDLVSLVIDTVTGKLYQAVGLDSVVLLPGDAPGVYVVRAYSGALGDEKELDAIPSFPGGTDLHEAAQSVNVALAIWDIVSVIVDTKGVMPVMDKFVIELAFRLSIVRAEYLPKNRVPTMNELAAFLQEALKTALEVLRDTGVDIAGTAAEKKLDILIKQSKVFSGAAGTLKSVLAGLDVAGKVGHVGDALLMFIEQVWWVSPVETSIILVGNPWEVGCEIFEDVEIPGNAEGCWQDTGIKVLEGDSLVFSASGLTDEGGHDQPYIPPDGVSDCKSGDGGQLPGAPCSGLIGRVGDHKFHVGSKRTVVAEDTGALNLGINDSACWDNSGSYSVTVEVCPK